VLWTRACRLVPTESALGGKSQGVRVSRKEFVRRVIWQIPIDSFMRLGGFRRSPPRRGFYLFALAAGEFHPLDESNATEIRIYMGNRLLPVRSADVCKG
jgi:hypothetical protein